MRVLPTEEIAYTVTERIYEQDPALLERYGEAGKRKCTEDNEHHLKHLQTAHELENEQFFTDYALWLNGILSKYGMNEQHLIDNFQLIDDVLLKEYSTFGESEAYRNYLAAAVQSLKDHAYSAAEKGRG
ncbi:hypothetical protein ACFQPF_14005 [Fictibacillus iocasae]|uniref:TipAS antibiotic-recognition domain-containing protein n=1 Tax=Fictibacillus iocasae TaxID=2715437 RepID=A0ABW2NSG3_9BACL